MKTKIILLHGTSGSGKTFLGEAMLAAYERRGIRAAMSPLDDPGRIKAMLASGNFHVLIVECNQKEKYRLPRQPWKTIHCQGEFRPEDLFLGMLTP